MNSRSLIDETRPPNSSSTPSNEDVGSLGCKETVHSAEAARILDEFRRAVERDPKGAQTAALRLVALLRGSGRTERVIARRGLASWQQRKLDRYLEKRLMEPMRTVDLADQVGLSVSHFSRAFKQTYGQPPHARIVLMRLKLAKQLMLATDDPLSHIALASGFADQAHFSKSFRRWLGDTPGAWRRRNFIGYSEPGSRRANEATPRKGGEGSDAHAALKAAINQFGIDKAQGRYFAAEQPKLFAREMRNAFKSRRG